MVGGSNTNLRSLLTTALEADHSISGMEVRLSAVEAAKSDADRLLSNFELFSALILDEIKHSYSDTDIQTAPRKTALSARLQESGIDTVNKLSEERTVDGIVVAAVLVTATKRGRTKEIRERAAEYLAEHTRRNKEDGRVVLPEMLSALQTGSKNVRKEISKAVRNISGPSRGLKTTQVRTVPVESYSKEIREVLRDDLASDPAAHPDFASKDSELILEVYEPGDRIVQTAVLQYLSQLVRSEPDNVDDIYSIGHEALSDDYWRIRDVGIRTLTNIGKVYEDHTRQCVESVAHALNDDFWRVSRTAQSALVEIGHSATETVVISLVHKIKEGDRYQRERAARCLRKTVQHVGDINSDVVVSVLDLLPNVSKRVRADLIRSTSAVVNQRNDFTDRFTTSIQEGLQADSAEVRSASLHAILRMVESDADPSLHYDSTLLDRLDDPSEDVRETAVRCLGKIAIESSDLATTLIDDLLAVISERATDPDQERSGQESFYQIYSEIEDLLNYTPEPRIPRYSTAEYTWLYILAKSSRKRTEYISQVMDALDASQSKRRRAAMRALTIAKHHFPEQIETNEIVKTCLDDPDETVRRTTLQFVKLNLDVIESDSVVHSAIEHGSDDPAVIVRREAIMTISQFILKKESSPSEIISILLEGLSDEAPRVRRSAARTVSIFIDTDDFDDPEKLVDILLERLNDENVTVVKMAAKALGDIAKDTPQQVVSRSEEIIPKIKDTNHDRSWFSTLVQVLIIHIPERFLNSSLFKVGIRTERNDSDVALELAGKLASRYPTRRTEFVNRAKDCLISSDPKVRIGALRVLQEFVSEYPEIIEHPLAPFERSLKDPVLEVRLESVEILGELGAELSEHTEGVIELLTEFVNDAYPDAERKIISTLVDVGEERPEYLSEIVTVAFQLLFHTTRDSSSLFDQRHGLLWSLQDVIEDHPTQIDPTALIPPEDTAETVIDAYSVSILSTVAEHAPETVAAELSGPMLAPLLNKESTQKQIVAVLRYLAIAGVDLPNFEGHSASLKHAVGADEIGSEGQTVLVDLLLRVETDSTISPRM